MGVEVLTGVLVSTITSAGATATAAGAAAAGAATAAGTAAAGAVTAAGAAAAGAVGAVATGVAGVAATTAAGAASAVATVGSAAAATITSAAASASAIGSATIATGSAFAGSAVSVGGTVVGAVTNAGGIVLSAGGTVIGTATGAIESAIAATAEMAAAAAAESTVLVGQIPVVGESLSGAIQAVGGMAGKITTHAAKTLGVSSKTAKTIGSIASNTTTNAINQQVLRPYNEVKDEITGLGDLKKNIKIIDDIAHGKIALDDIKDIAVEHKEEIVKEVLEQSDLKEIKDNFDLVQNIVEGRYTKEQLADIAIQKLDDPAISFFHKQRGLLRKIRSGELTKEELADVILENSGLAQNKDIELLRKICSGNASKDELQEAVLASLDIDNEEMKRLQQDVDVLRKISEHQATKDELQRWLLTEIDRPEFEELKANKELLVDIRAGRVNLSGLSALVSEGLGVKGLGTYLEDPVEFPKGKDCFLSVCTAYSQKGNFYDIKIPTQTILKSFEAEVSVFFPSVLFSVGNYADGKYLVLHECSLQHVGEPVVYSIISFLLSKGVSFTITEANRTITITSTGYNRNKVISIYNKYVSHYSGRNITYLQPPQMFPYQYSVEETMNITKELKTAGAKVRIDSCGDTPSGTWNLDIYGINEERRADFYRTLTLNYDFLQSEVDEIYKGLNNSGKYKLFCELSFQDAVAWAVALNNTGAYCGIFANGSNCSLFEEYIHTFKDARGVEVYKLASILGVGFNNQTTPEDYAEYSIYAGRQGNTLYIPCYGRILTIYSDNITRGFVSRDSTICDIDNYGNVYHVVSPVDAYITYLVDRYDIVNEGETFCNIVEVETDSIRNCDSIYAGYRQGMLYAPIEGSIIRILKNSSQPVLKDEALAEIWSRGQLLKILSPIDTMLGSYYLENKNVSKDNPYHIEMFDRLCKLYMNFGY